MTADSVITLAMEPVRKNSVVDWVCAIENAEAITPTATLRGGWQLSAAVTRSGFAYAPTDYAGYKVLRNGVQAPFVVPGFEDNQLGGSFRVTTPTLQMVSATSSISYGSTPIFREAAEGVSTRIDGTIDLRPTAALRNSISFSRLVLNRSRDGSRFSTETIPRIKTEYQVTRAIFFRLVGQYSARSRTPLQDRDGNP